MSLRKLIPVFFFICIRFVHAQDLIVKSNGDSLNCKIVYVESEFIHFTYKDEKNEMRVSMLPSKQVIFHKRNFYSTSENSQDQAVNDSIAKAQGKNVNVPYQKIRIGFYGGYSYLTAKVRSGFSQEITEYLEELKSGYHFGLDFTYFTSELYGFGLKYSNFGTRNEMEKVTIYDNTTGQSYTGSMRDDITIQFLAPSFSVRMSSENKKQHFIAHVALGFLWYKNDAIVISPFTLTGNTIGLQLGASGDFAVAKDVFLGFGLSYLMGSIKEFEFDNGTQQRTIKFEEGSAEGMNRVDVSIGIHWCK